MSRPVWISKREASICMGVSLALRNQGSPTAERTALADALESIATRHAAAPDPVEAVLANRRILYRTGMEELLGDLRALGMPDES